MMRRHARYLAFSRLAVYPLNNSVDRGAAMAMPTQRTFEPCRASTTYCLRYAASKFLNVASNSHYFDEGIWRGGMYAGGRSVWSFPVLVRYQLSGNVVFVIPA